MQNVATVLEITPSQTDWAAAADSIPRDADAKARAFREFASR